MRSEQINVLLDKSVDSTKSTAFKLPAGLQGISFVPPTTANNGKVTLEVYTPTQVRGDLQPGDDEILASEDTDWLTVGTNADGTALDLADTGVENKVVSATGDVLAFWKGMAGRFVRFVHGGTQAADVTFKVYVQVEQ